MSSIKTRDEQIIAGRLNVCDTRDCLVNSSSDCRFITCDIISRDSWDYLKGLGDRGTFMKIFKLSFGKGHVFALLVQIDHQLLFHNRPRNDSLVHDFNLMLVDVAGKFDEVLPDLSEQAINHLMSRSDYISLLVNSFDEVALDDWFGVLVDELMRDLKQPKEDQYLTKMLDDWVEKGKTEGDENLIEAFHNGCGRYINNRFMPLLIPSDTCSKDEVPPHVLHMNDDTIRADRFCPVGTRRRKEMINKHVKLGFQTSLRFDEYGAKFDADEETHHSSRFKGCCRKDTAAMKAWRRVKYSILRDALPTSEEYEANERAKSEDAKEMMKLLTTPTDKVDLEQLNEANVIKVKDMEDEIERAKQMTAQMCLSERQIQDRMKQYRDQLAALDKRHDEKQAKLTKKMTKVMENNTGSSDASVGETGGTATPSDLWDHITSKNWKKCIDGLDVYLRSQLPPEELPEYYEWIPEWLQDKWHYAKRCLYRAAIWTLVTVISNPLVMRCTTMTMLQWKQSMCGEISRQLGLEKRVEAGGVQKFEQSVYNVSDSFREGMEWVMAINGPRMADMVWNAAAGIIDSLGSLAESSGLVGIRIICKNFCKYILGIFTETWKMALINQMYTDGLANLLKIINPTNCIKRTTKIEIA